MYLLQVYVLVLIIVRSISITVICVVVEGLRLLIHWNKKQWCLFYIRNFELHAIILVMIFIITQYEK